MEKARNSLINYYEYMRYYKDSEVEERTDTQDSGHTDPIKKKKNKLNL